MCCTVTGTPFLAALIVAALIALAIMTPPPFRFRRAVAAAWLFVPIAAAAAFYAALATNGHAADGLFAAAIFVLAFQPPWLLAAGAGGVLGIALRWAMDRLVRLRRGREDHHA